MVVASRSRQSWQKQQRQRLKGIIGDTSKVEADIKNMEEWEGTWRSFAEYCNDEKMQDAWGDIADAFELQEEQLKSTFDSLCFITDDVVKLEIKDGVVTAYDTEAKEVFPENTT